MSSGEDAYRKIRAGASLVEIYTAMAYEGAWCLVFWGRGVIVGVQAPAWWNSTQGGCLVVVFPPFFLLAINPSLQ